MGHDFKQTFIKNQPGVPPICCFHCMDLIVGLTKATQDVVICLKCKAILHRFCIKEYGLKVNCKGDTLQHRDTNLKFSKSVGNLNSRPVDEKNSDETKGINCFCCEISLKFKKSAPEVEKHSVPQVPHAYMNQIDEISMTESSSSTYEQPRAISKNNVKYITLYDFKARPNTEELSIDFGSLVTEIQSDDAGWTLVKLGSKEGFVPTSYIKKLS